jgi:hypothetical protein
MLEMYCSNVLNSCGRVIDRLAPSSLLKQDVFCCIHLSSSFNRQVLFQRDDVAVGNIKITADRIIFLKSRNAPVVIIKSSCHSCCTDRKWVCVLVGLGFKLTAHKLVFQHSASTGQSTEIARRRRRPTSLEPKVLAALLHNSRLGHISHKALSINFANAFIIVVICKQVTLGNY